MIIYVFCLRMFYTQNQLKVMKGIVLFLVTKMQKLLQMNILLDYVQKLKTKTKDPNSVIEDWLNKLQFDINDAYRLSWDDKYAELCNRQNKKVENNGRFGKDMPVVNDLFNK